MTTTTILRNVDQVHVTYRLDGRYQEREFRTAHTRSTLAGTGHPITFDPEPMTAAEDFALRVMTQGAGDIIVVPFTRTRAHRVCARYGHDFQNMALPHDRPIRMCLRCARHEKGTAS